MAGTRERFADASRKRVAVGLSRKWRSHLSSSRSAQLSESGPVSLKNSFSGGSPISIARRANATFVERATQGFASEKKPEREAPVEKFKRGEKRLLHPLAANQSRERERA